MFSYLQYAFSFFMFTFYALRILALNAAVCLFFEIWYVLSCSQLVSSLFMSETKYLIIPRYHKSEEFHSFGHISFWNSVENCGYILIYPVNHKTFRILELYLGFQKSLWFIAILPYIKSMHFTLIDWTVALPIL